MKNVSLFHRMLISIIIIGLVVLTSCNPPKSSNNEENNIAIPVTQTTEEPPKRQVSLEEAIAKVNEGNGVFAKMLENDSMFVGLYTPKQTDNQRPHDKDEVYIIASGNGEFLNGKEKTTFKEGDVIFVPAGEEHRFLNFSENFKAWVVFY